MYSLILSILTLLFLIQGSLAQTAVRLMNLECEALDKKFGYFEICGYNLTNEGKKDFNMILRLLQLPVTNCQIQLEVNVTSPIQIPITFNATYDMCKFLENPVKNRILERFYKTLVNFVNTNHTCPYNHDLYLSGLSEIPVSIDLPWPSAQYEFITTWIVDDIKRVKVVFNVEVVNRGNIRKMAKKRKF